MRPPASAARRRQDGVTLLEMAVVVFVLSLVSGAVFGIASSSAFMFDETNRQFDVDETGRRLMDRLTNELRIASAATLLPVVIDDSPTVTFQQVTGFDGTNPILTPPITIAFQLAAGETPNGLDDNGDGRVDEGSAVMTVGGDPPRTLAANISDLRFTASANGLTFTARASSRDRRGVLIARVFQQGVTFRN